jgi:hypothetical protein
MVENITNVFGDKDFLENEWHGGASKSTSLSKFEIKTKRLQKGVDKMKKSCIIVKVTSERTWKCEVKKVNITKLSTKRNKKNFEKSLTRNEQYVKIIFADNRKSDSKQVIH